MVSPRPAMIRGRWSTTERRPAHLVLRGAGALVIAAATAVSATACTAPRPGPSPTSTSRAPSATPIRAIATDEQLHDAVLARLPREARAAESLTWTTDRPTPAPVSIDLSDADLLLAAACDGGGAITVTITGLPDRVLECDGLRSLGPIDISTAGGTDPPGGAEFEVVSSGHPHWAARASAVDTASID